MVKNVRVVISSILIFSLLLLYFPGKQVDAKEENASNVLNDKYSTYEQEIKIKTYNGRDLVYSGISEYIVDSNVLKKIDGEQAVEIGQGETVTFKLDVAEEARYQIGIRYKTDAETILSSQLEMKVNDKFPFYELRNLIFENQWETPKEVSKDKYGNEIVPQPTKVTDWQEKYIGDSSYRNSDPFLIKLNKGENEITFRSIEGTMYIQQFILSAPKELGDYDNETVSGSNLVIVEGENIAFKNDSSIRAAASYDVNVTPYSSGKRILNYLDNESFKKAGQKVEYEFEVKEAGYYYLGFNYKQSVKKDYPVFMNIAIDGEIPFKQLKNYPFDYTSKYTTSTLQDLKSGENLPIYLDAGKHTLSFSISIDSLKKVLEEIERITSEIQELSLELNNLAGPNVDRNRDIDAETFIPGITDQLIDWAEQLNGLSEEVSVYNPDVDEIGAFSSLTIVEKLLRSIANEPKKIVKRKNELSTGTNSITAYLGNLMQEMNDNGIAIDKFYFYQNDKNIPKGKNVLSSLYSKAERLIKSFGSQDYAIDNIDDEHLQVWINRPRQYIEIIQQLIDEQFTPETGIKVDISIMPDENKLILSNAAGNAPDVALGINYALPFEIAIRGALQDLTEFDDFDEVSTRFPEGLHVPATVGDGIYALPDTMNFWVLFYRNDVLESMDLPIPDTIDQIRTYLPELQRKGMNFFYPTAGMAGLKTFAGTMPIIYQNGGSFYGDTISKTTLNDNKSIEGMRELTELFTIYNTPYEVPSFYQQFRDGSIPIGISDYFMYNLILNAAPEIANSWNISLMPGIANEEGEVERWSAGGAESNVIFSETNKKDEAWEFLKWWSSTEVQVAFGNTLQTTYGREYIWNPANMNAFAGLPWVSNHKQVILEQTEWLTEVPRVPGSYMLEREISNAYNSIVLDGDNLRTAVDLANKRINRETYRKLEEFGYMKDGEVIIPYPNPEIIKE